MNKKRFIPRTKSVIHLLKPYWIEYRKIEAESRHNLRKLEEVMQKKFKSDQIVFEVVDGKVIGIGSKDPKFLKLVKAEELEKE